MATLGKQLMDFIDKEPLAIAASGRESGLTAEQKHGLYLLWHSVAEDKLNQRLGEMLLRPWKIVLKSDTQEPEPDAPAIECKWCGKTGETLMAIHKRDNSTAILYWLCHDCKARQEADEAEYGPGFHHNHGAIRRGRSRRPLMATNKETLTLEDALAEFPKECEALMGGDYMEMWKRHGLLCRIPSLDSNLLLAAALRWLAGKELTCLTEEAITHWITQRLTGVKIRMPSDVLRWALEEVRAHLQREKEG